MFARAKIKLSDIPTELVEQARTTNATLTCELNATNHRDQPATGSVRPPDLAWSIAI